MKIEIPHGGLELQTNGGANCELRKSNIVQDGDCTPIKPLLLEDHRLSQPTPASLRTPSIRRNYPPYKKKHDLTTQKFKKERTKM